MDHGMCAIASTVYAFAGNTVTDKRSFGVEYINIENSSEAWQRIIVSMPYLEPIRTKYAVAAINDTEIAIVGGKP